MFANAVGCLFVSTFSCVLFVKCAACGFAALWIDVCCRGSGVGFVPSRKPCLAGDLDDRVDNICSARSFGDRGWQSYCTPAFQECVKLDRLFFQDGEDGIPLSKRAFFRRYAARNLQPSKPTADAVGYSRSLLRSYGGNIGTVNMPLGKAAEGRRRWKLRADRFVKISPVPRCFRKC